MTTAREIAPAKINLALHVRGTLPDGRHAIETIFAFCADGDRLSAEPADDISLAASGQFARDLPDAADNLVLRAARALREAAGIEAGRRSGSTSVSPSPRESAAARRMPARSLRLLTSLWHADPAHAEAIAPGLGSDVPAGLLAMPARGEGAGDRLTRD